MRYGYVCELQEPSCIANPGVLVGLNSLLDNCQEITLPTGERVKRHPGTVIVVTTNSDYAGCRDMNQSIISRMDLIYDISSPDLATMVKRVMNVTGCTDEQETTKMAQVVQDIAKRCHEVMINDGSCGMRELKAWVLSTMITKDPYESAFYQSCTRGSRQWRYRLRSPLRVPPDQCRSQVQYRYSRRRYQAKVGCMCCRVDEKTNVRIGAGC